MSAAPSIGATVLQVIHEIRSGLLAPEKLEWLTQQIKDQAREQRSGRNLGKLKTEVSRLDTRSH